MENSSTRARSPTPVSEVTGENDPKIRANSTNNVADDKPAVKITVQKQHTKDVTFLVKRNAPLGKLMFKYCLKMGFDDKALKFTYDGTQVKDHETPLSLNMEDEDVIDCWSDQVGGRGRGRGRGCNGLKY